MWLWYPGIKWCWWKSDGNSAAAADAGETCLGAARCPGGRSRQQSHRPLERSVESCYYFCSQFSLQSKLLQFSENIFLLVTDTRKSSILMTTVFYLNTSPPRHSRWLSFRPILNSSVLHLVSHLSVCTVPNAHAATFIALDTIIAHLACC